MTKEEKVFVIDADGWSIGNFQDFVTAMANNDYRAAGELMAKVIVSWPYDLEPNKENIAGLRMSWFKKLSKAVNDAVTEMYGQGN